jgi:hypothetical protein
MLRRCPAAAPEAPAGDAPESPGGKPKRFREPAPGSARLAFALLFWQV